MVETEPAPLIIVCDAGPLIHLDELACLDLLADFTRVLVPMAVWEEVSQHRPAALATESVSLQKVAPSTPASSELDGLVRLLALHRGEQQALQIAQENVDCILLSDDTAARLAARNLHLIVHGTIGVLVRAIRRKQRTRDEVMALLKSLPSISTLHLRPQLLEHILREIEQSS